MDNIIEQVQRGKYSTSFDLQKIKQIVQKANKPEDAFRELEKIGIKDSISSYQEEVVNILKNQTDLDITKNLVAHRYSTIDSKAFRQSVANTDKYISNPNLKNNNLFAHSSSVLAKTELDEVLATIV